MTVVGVLSLISLRCVGRAGFCDQREWEEQSLAPCFFGSAFQGRASRDLVVRLE